MNHDEYLRLTRRTAELVEAGDLPAAIDILHELLASELSDRDKAMMCLNLAVVYDKSRDTIEALRWYDHGIHYELPQGQFFVAESKATYLAERGNIAESVALYEELLGLPSLTELDEARISHNLAVLRFQSGDHADFSKRMQNCEHAARTPATNETWKGCGPGESQGREIAPYPAG